jgi:hypothetical protein
VVAVRIHQVRVHPWVAHHNQLQAEADGKVVVVMICPFPLFLLRHLLQHLLFHLPLLQHLPNDQLDDGWVYRKMLLYEGLYR